MRKLLIKLYNLLLNLAKSLLSFGVLVGFIVLVWFAIQPGFFNRIGLIKPNVIRVGVVRPFGAAGLLYENQGIKPNETSLFFKKYGFKVQIVPLKNELHARDMLLSDSIDVMNMSTATFARDADTLSKLQPQLVLLAGWSRGNDALVVREGVQDITDLYEVPVAYVPKSAQFFFLKWLLKWSGLEQDEIQGIEVNSEEEAIQSFTSGKAKAVVLSNANVAKCIDLVSGNAKILQTSETASHILDHSYWVKASYYDDHKKDINRLLRVWLKGNVQVRINEEAQKKVVQILHKTYDFSLIDAGDFLRKTYLTGYRDNKNFLGINKSYSGIRAKEIYEYALSNVQFIDTLQRANLSIRYFNINIDTTNRKLFNIQSLQLYKQPRKQKVYQTKSRIRSRKKRTGTELDFRIRGFKESNWELEGNGYLLTYTQAVKDAKAPKGYVQEQKQLDYIASISFDFDRQNGLIANYQTLRIQEKLRHPSDFKIKTDSLLPWKKFINIKPIKSFELVGEHHLAERIEYRTQSMRNSQAFRYTPSVATFQLEVHYPQESIRLPVEAKGQLDEQFLMMSKIFGKCMIRIEAQADEWQDAQRNDYFAYKRAEAVSNYLVAEHKFNPRRFIILGNDTLVTNRPLNASTDYKPSNWIELALLGTLTNE